MPIISLSFVAAIALFASKSSLYVRAVEFCPSGTDPTYIHAVTTAGADDQALSCTIGQSESPTILTINLRDAPTGAGDASLVRFQGTVAPLSAIVVRFPSSTQALNGIPLHVTISDTQFGEGSGLQITGSLPSSSSLTISGNTFAVSAGQQGSWFVNAFTAIALFPESDDNFQDLNDDAQVTISDNTITGSGDLSTFKATIGISWRDGGVNYGSGVAVQIVRNSITLACQSNLNPSTDQQACVVGLHLMANQFFTGFASSLAVDSNAFTISGGLVAAMPPISSIGGVIGTFVSFSENSCQATTTGAVGPDAVTFGSLSFGSDAQYAIKNNTLSLIGTTACGVGFSPKIPVDQMWDGGEGSLSGFTDSAVVSFTSNTIQTIGCDAQIHFGRDHQFGGNSRFLINSNSLTRTDQLGSSAAIQVLNSLTVQDGAALSISTNTWSAPTTSGDAQLIGYALSPSAGVTGGLGSVRACGNVLHGSTLSTDAQVRARCPDGLSGVITASQCVVEGPEDTLQNTLTTSTAAPSTAEPTLAPTTTIVGQSNPTTSAITVSGPTTTRVATLGSETTTSSAAVQSSTADLLNGTGTGEPSFGDVAAMRVAGLILFAVYAAHLMCI